MKDIRDLLGLPLSNLPHPSTVCRALERFSMSLFRQLLSKTIALFELGDVTAIDASGFDRIAASRRYEKRTGYRFLAMKTTLLTDCSSGAILDIHCSMSRPHDTQIGWQVLQRNTELIHTLTGDKGYDWDALRAMLREQSVRPVIKHREFDSLDVAHTARLDDETYHRRSVVECSFRILKQRYSDSLKATIWYKQFREMALKAVVKT